MGAVSAKTTEISRSRDVAVKEGQLLVEKITSRQKLEKVGKNLKMGKKCVKFANWAKIGN